MRPARGFSRHISGWLLATVGGWALGSAVLADTPPATEQVLGRLARVASLYRDSALDFTCNETFYYNGPDVSSVHKFSYIYGYSEESGQLSDYRARRRDLSRIVPASDLFGGDGPPEALLRAYSWVFVFETEVQPFYDYRVEGEQTLDGRPAIGVHFSARKPFQPGLNEWDGVAWVDRESYQLLRVDAIRARDRETRRAYEATMKLERLANPEHVLAFEFSDYRTEFDVVVNGMRFPGRVVIERTHHTVKGSASGEPNEKAIDRYRVRQVYDDYEFFAVRTQAQIEAIVAGSDQ